MVVQFVYGLLLYILIEMHHERMERTWKQRQGRHQTPVRRRVKARRGTDGRAGRRGVRNAPRLRTMPSPITYTSSWIACPALVAASLPPHLFLLTVFLQCFTDPTDYFNILTTRNKNYN